MTGPRAEHVPVVPPFVGAAARRPDARLVEQLRAVPAQAVGDAVGALYTMDPGMRLLTGPVPRLVGPALTVKAVPGDNLAVLGALALAGPGDVLVVDWHGWWQGCGTGARNLGPPRARGLAGVVVDGGWRDLQELRADAFPVFGRGEAPWSPAKREPGEVNVPVSCGGVVVCPGDVVVADAGGVVVVPARHLAEVVDAVTLGGQDGPDPEAGARRHADAFAARGGVRA